MTVPIARFLKAVVPVVLFPEGTSSDGSSLLRFRSSLLEAAIATRVPTAPAVASYELDEGSVPNEISDWRDMVFGRRFWNPLGKRSITASLRFGSFQRPIQNRKELARTSRLAILELRKDPDLATACSTHEETPTGEGCQKRCI